MNTIAINYQPSTVDHQPSPLPRSRKTMIFLHCMANRHEPMAPVPGGRTPMVCTPEEAVEAVRSHHRVFVQGIAATPTLLTQALAERGKQVKWDMVDTTLEGYDGYWRNGVPYGRLTTIEAWRSRTRSRTVSDGRLPNVPMKNVAQNGTEERTLTPSR